MSEQKYLNVDMKVAFNIPVDEDFDIEELSEEDLKEMAAKYFFNGEGYDEADYYDFEFSLD